MDGKEQFARDNIAREQFVAVLILYTQLEKRLVKARYPGWAAQSEIVYTGHKKTSRIGEMCVCYYFKSIFYKLIS